MERYRHLITGLLMLLAGSQALADNMYITDNLLVGIYADRTLSGKPVKLVKTGTALEVLQRDGDKVEVRTADGARGWLRASYLTAQQPAAGSDSQKVASLTARNKRLWTKYLNLEREHKKLQAEAQQLQKQVSDLSQQAESGSQGLKKLQAQLAALRQDKTGLEGRLETVAAERDRLKAENDDYRAREQGHPWYTWVLAFGITFLVGVIAGIALLDWRIRRRHGGFRIY